MRRSALMTLLVAGTQWLAAQPGAGMLSEQVFRRSVSLEAQGRYLLYLPGTYDRDTVARWPLVMFLHGAGERGDDLAHLRRHGPARLAAEGRDLGFILVAPQCPDSSVWSVEALRALLDEAEARYRVDPRRIYLTGLSHGGWGVWNLAMAYPGRFAAIAPVCGRTDRFMRERVCRLRGVPTWVFHGAKDDVVPLADSETMVEALRACGGNVQFTVYPEAYHNAWDTTYADARFYAWLLSQRQP